MKRNPIARLLRLLGQLPGRGPADIPVGCYHPDDFPRLEDLLNARSVTYFPEETDSPSYRAIRDARRQAPEDATASSRAEPGPTALDKSSPIIPAESSASFLAEDASRPVSRSRIRKQVRRQLRLLDRAIAEVARDPRPR